MRYIIYQIKDIEKTDYSFMNWNTAKSQFKFKDYNKVYYGDCKGKDDKDILENLFEIFNIDHPKDFTGHSLSVSDIVILYDDKDYKYYYCDSIGWIDVTKEIKERDIK